jgi:hypothetical protein
MSVTTFRINHSTSFIFPAGAWVHSIISAIEDKSEKPRLRVRQYYIYVFFRF